MPETPDTPALREKREDETVAWLALGEAVNAIVEAGGSMPFRSAMCAKVDADYRAACIRVRAAVAARVTAELLEQRERRHALIDDQLREAAHRKEDGWPGY